MGVGFAQENQQILNIPKSYKKTFQRDVRYDFNKRNRITGNDTPEKEDSEMSQIEQNNNTEETQPTSSEPEMIDFSKLTTSYGGQANVKAAIRKLAETGYTLKDLNDQVQEAMAQGDKDISDINICDIACDIILHDAGDQIENILELEIVDIVPAKMVLHTGGNSTGNLFGYCTIPKDEIEKAIQEASIEQIGELAEYSCVIIFLKDIGIDIKKIHQERLAKVMWDKKSEFYKAMSIGKYDRFETAINEFAKAGLSPEDLEDAINKFAEVGLTPEDLGKQVKKFQKENNSEDELDEINGIAHEHILQQAGNKIKEIVEFDIVDKENGTKFYVVIESVGPTYDYGDEGLTEQLENTIQEADINKIKTLVDDTFVRVFLNDVNIDINEIYKTKLEGGFECILEQKDTGGKTI